MVRRRFPQKHLDQQKEKYMNSIDVHSNLVKAWGNTPVRILGEYAPIGYRLLENLQTGAKAVVTPTCVTLENEPIFRILAAAVIPDPELGRLDSENRRWLEKY